MDNPNLSIDYVHFQCGFVKLSIFLIELYKIKYTE